MIRSRLTNEDGMTLIEVIVAAIIIVIAMTALAQVFIGAGDQATADVHESELLNLADQQIELVRANVQATGQFGRLALSAAPAALTLPGVSATRQGTWTDPTRYENGTTPTSATAGNVAALCFEIESNYDAGTVAAPPSGFTPWANCTSSPLDGEPLAVLTGNPLVTVSNPATGWPTTPCPTVTGASLVTPCTVTLASGFHVTVYTFVTYSYAACAAVAASGSSTGVEGCPSLNGTGQVKNCDSATGDIPFPSTTASSTPCADTRRVTVAVVPQETHGTSRQTPAYLSTLLTNPSPSVSQNGSAGLILGLTL